MNKIRQNIIEQMNLPDGITIGKIREIGGFENTNEVLDFLKDEFGLELLEIIGKRIEDINDDYPIRMIDIDLSNDPLLDQIDEVINKLNAPEGISLKEIKELTGWNNENLAENMNTYLNCNLTMILQEAVTDEFRIRHSQD